MNTLAEIAKFCADSIGMPDEATLKEAKKSVQLRWRAIWDYADWKQAHFEVLAIVPKDVEEVEMPPEVELVKAIRIGGNRELLPSSQITQIGVDPAGIGKPGGTYAFSPVARTGAGAVCIRLHRPLSSDQEILIMAKRKCPELLLDTDKPSIAGADNCLIEFCKADLLENILRAYTKADVLKNQARAMLEQMSKIETIQTATTVRFVPCVDQAGYSSETDWLVTK
jgi:hypothetical protein